MNQYISFSGGVESTTMCVLYGGTADAITADTGWEHEIMYQRWDEVEGKIREFHKNDFKIHRVKGSTTVRGQVIDNLPDYIKATKFFPSPVARYCTRLFKIEPIDEFLRDKGECELMIGLNAEEGDKRTGNLGELENVKYTYPLYKNGLTRSHCARILKHAGLMPAFPPYMSRGGCVGCFFKRVTEYEALVLLNEDEASAVAELEDSIQDGRDKHYGVRDGIPNMKEFIERVKQEQLFKPEEIYDYDRYESISTPCGVFCHR